MIAGRQSFSASSSERHTVPDGYTFGWKSAGENWPVAVAGERVTIGGGPAFGQESLGAETSKVRSNFQGDTTSIPSGHRQHPIP